MAETRQIVELWRRAREQKQAVYLATVVHVEGSSYRKPGARMLVSAAGERAGSISGGCLEAEVSRRIAWLTSDGPSVERYSSSFDDDNEGVPYGLGCGGTIWILMETGRAADATLAALEASVTGGDSLLILLADLSQSTPGTIVIGGAEDAEEKLGLAAGDSEQRRALLAATARALRTGEAISLPSEAAGELPAFLLMPILSPPHVWIFGAGDDAQPIVRFAAELGWHVTVTDGRSHLLRPERFPEADHLHLLTYESGTGDPHFTTLTGCPELGPGDLAVILTHSYEQDRALLQGLLPQGLRYLGILGPLHRTTRLVDSVAPALKLSPEECLARLHAPVGLMLGPGEPSVIALAIISEMQATLARTEGRVERKRDQPLGRPGAADPDRTLADREIGSVLVPA